MVKNETSNPADPCNTGHWSLTLRGQWPCLTTSSDENPLRSASSPCPGCSSLCMSEGGHTDAGMGLTEMNFLSYLLAYGCSNGISILELNTFL